MAPYARVPEHLGPADFRPCCKKVCADSAFYTQFFAELVWRALPNGCGDARQTRADLVPEVLFSCKQAPACLSGARW